MPLLEVPGAHNEFLSVHAQLLISSYRRITGKELLAIDCDPVEIARTLFEAPFGLVSHNTDPVPVFNYGNATALAAFEMDWSSFVRLASRDSAEPENRAERELLMAQVTQNGFVDNYRGIRISSSGRRFWIERATIWNIIDEAECYRGQAAVFYLED